MDELKTVNVKLSCSDDRRFHEGDIIHSFKGELYEIIGCGFSRYWDCEVMVFKRLTDDNIFVEPCRKFYDRVDKVEFPESDQDYKFLKIIKYENIK